MSLAALRRLLGLVPAASLPPGQRHVPPRPLPVAPSRGASTELHTNAAAEAAVAAALRDVPPEWHVVPGQRIELGDTGFSVTLLTGPDEYTYELGVPEGQKLARSGDLGALKQVAMRLALERREFMYPPAPVK